MLTIDKIFHASVVLKNIIRPTSIVHTEGITEDCSLYLKPECLQKTGSFKLRGSGYKISMLSPEEKARGVIACSAGNHAQGVAGGICDLPAGQRAYLQDRGHEKIRRQGVSCGWGL